MRGLVLMKISRHLGIIAVVLSLSACLSTTLDDGSLQLTKLNVAIKPEGSGIIQAHYIIPSSLASLVEKEKGLAGLNILAEYGLEDLDTKIERDDNASAFLVASGKYSDVLQLVKVLDSSVPFSLREDVGFRIQWDGKTFVMAFADATNHDVSSKQRSPEYLFTSEGFIFDRDSTGSVSDDAKKLLIKASDIKDGRMVLKMHVEHDHATK